MTSIIEIALNIASILVLVALFGSKDVRVKFHDLVEAVAIFIRSLI